MAVSIKQLSKTTTGDYNLDKFQDEVIRVVNPIAKNVLVEGKVLSNVDLYTGSINHVAHSLDKDWSFWFLIGNDSNAVVYEGSQLKRERFLSLNVSADTTVSIFVG